MNNDTLPAKLLLLIIILGVVGMLSIIWISRNELDALKAEAIKRNAAHWKVDAATGKSEFEWNEVKP